MIAIDPSSRSERDNYKFMTGSIIPRPIAWVTTMSPAGIVNAAPFSYFNIVTSNPPMISVSVQRKNGAMKDTARNAEALGEFVVQIADEHNVESVNRTAANLGPEESEADTFGLALAQSEVVRVPGLADAAVRMECSVERILTLGGTADTPACDLLIGRIVRFHIDERIYDERGHVDAEGLRPVSRLAGNNYAKLGGTFELDRPS
ncbi:flavin reductase family protein [Paenibacillus sacheonensis]|uniref:Flavin reductase family protein n=1 Tax=Paenibacillus sacheonensis TaxID=742054 RepID=A0A7X5BYU8_9BACL|nr:flavin reductase family protein [Paenibacillus sacheonensis]MBM7564125.1 flavin reductase (DIM6/NTAB) family NADH-FMN oxidoreductase RutF [Paenibacillus sacheonensis]NBC67545.1 flavin reductase family protein [Paenibacillus sacheonensis]